MTPKTLELILNADQDLIAREVPSQRVLEVAVKAPDAMNSADRAPLNLALVLDRSGSMSGGKLEYVKQAAMHAVDLLHEKDRVAFVVFDDQVSLLSPSMPMTPRNRQDLKNRIRDIEVGGSTNLSGGWLAGCKEIASTMEDGTINRALLLTDGQANVGITDPDELARHARELSARGISTSTFGVGMGFNEHLLEAMSNQGNGSFYFIRTPSQIPELFEREFKELSTITARDVKITLSIPAQVDANVIGGWRFEKDSENLHIDLGNLYAGRTQEAYIKLLTPPSSSLSRLAFQVRVSAVNETGEKVEKQAEVIFKYASESESRSAQRNQPMLQRFAGVDLAELAGEALKLERAGEKERASHLLKRALEENRPYIDDQRAREYEHMAERMKRGMDEDDLKTSHQQTYLHKRRREP